MKKVFTTPLLVLGLVGFIGLIGSLAGASTINPVQCDPAYTAWIGAPGSEQATCLTIVASDMEPASTYCDPAYTAWIGAPGSEQATCPAIVSTHGNNARN